MTTLDVVAHDVVISGRKDDLSAARGEETRQDIQQGGFPTAARSEDTDELPVGDAEINFPKRALIAVVVAYAFQANQVRHCSNDLSKSSSRFGSFAIRGSFPVSPRGFALPKILIGGKSRERGSGAPLLVPDTS